MKTPTIHSVCNGPADASAQPWFTVRNLDEGTAEITIYQDIGTNWWSEESADAQWISNQLKAIPKGQKINVRINSRGGNVWDGLVMYNLLKARRDDVTVYIDGIAASIASIIALAGSKLIIPKNGMMMIHDPHCYCEGTEKDMQDAAKLLRSTKDSLVSVYIEETGQPEKDIRSKMEETTWFTGQEAFDYGFATDLTDEVKVAAHFDLSRFRNVPKAIAAETTTEDPMKPRNIHLDPTPAGTPASGSGGAAPAKPVAADTNLIDIKNELDTVKAQLARERKDSVERAIDNLVAEGRVVASSRDFYVGAALKDDSIVAELRKNPVIQPPSAPITQMVDTVKASLADIGKEMTRLRAPQDAFRKGQGVSPEQVSASSLESAQFHAKNRERMLEVLNANTIGSSLKRNVILQEIMRAFARRIAPLSAFSTKFSNIPLQGTAIVSVPYFPLESAASTDWNQSNGYVMGDSTQNAKDVTINKRKYQPIRFNSDELTRQPALNLMKIAEAKAEKLAADVFADVLSVVTLANFGTAGLVVAAAAVVADDIATLKGVCDVADWPSVGRSLLLGSAYDVKLLKDSGVKSALNFGSNDPIARGSIGQIYGFDYFMCNYIPGNAQNLTGFASFMSAILFAQAPITPDSEVMSQLAGYEVITDPQTGASFEYRTWGNADFDERRQVIECNYGFAAGETAALKRITSA